MLKDRFFILLFFALVVVGVVHVTGNLFFLYWKFPWLDIISHFFGGFWVGGAALLIYSRTHINRFDSKKWLHVILLALVTGLAVGVMWEIFEVFIELTNLPNEKYFSDTVADLVFDTIGAFIAALSFLYCSNQRHFSMLSNR